MNYTKKLLGKGENILLIKHRHWLVWRPTFLICLLMAIVFLAVSILASFWLLPQYSVAAPLLYLPFASLLIPLFVFLPTWIRWSAEQYIVTDRRIIQLDGILAKHSIDSSLDKINDIELNQSLFGRMFGYGNLEIMTGSDVGLNMLKNIQDPLKFKIALLDAKEKLRMHEVAAPQAQAAPASLSVTLQELTDVLNKGLITQDEYNAKRAKLMESI